MDFNQYRAQALRTESTVNTDPLHPIAAHGILSAAALTGELADVAKRTIAYGASFDLERFKRVAEALANAGAFLSYFAEAIALNDDATLKAAVAGEGMPPETTSYMQGFNYGTVPARGLHAVLGTISEAGELSEIFAKAIGGEVIDPVHVGEELADGRWYDAAMSDTFQLDSNSLSEANIAKLKARFPGKFTQEAALNRDLAAERVQLETVTAG